MNHRGVLALVVAAVVAGGCTSPDGIPATTPSIAAPASTSPSTTESLPAEEATTSTPLATTTTPDRMAEVTAIFQDLEQRRLEAIYTGDVEAFTALFAHTPYLERSLEVFDLVEPGEVPTIEIEVLEILRDDDTCLAVWTQSEVGHPAETSEPSTKVLTRPSGSWTFAFVSDEKGGWLCEGPHPLSES